MPIEIGTPEAAKLLIKELYMDLRNKVNKWSAITKQTPQARMGYVGQHLVSVVTGYPGGRSGARGHDIELPDGNYAEIKTCYRVDQLGSCNNCGAVVSSIETKCSSCGSEDICRKEDSKWLIGIRNDDEFEKILDPKYYYFVLFDFEDIEDQNNNNIVATIWQVDPKGKGFAYCMFDYYLNIRSKSASKAPFNMWPYDLKFLLTRPKRIFKCTIADDEIDITTFPNIIDEGEEYIEDLVKYSSSRTMSLNCVKNTIINVDPTEPITTKDKKKLLSSLEHIRKRDNISDDSLCAYLVDAIYLPLLIPVKDKIPKKYRVMYPSLQD